MFKWIREFREYSQHENWLENHFGGFHKSDGSFLLTEIYNRVEGEDPNSERFRKLAAEEIKNLTEPCDIFGHVVSHPDPNNDWVHSVPARVVTIDAVRIHGLHCKKLREDGQKRLGKMAKRHPDLAKTMGWKGDKGGD